jgi:flagellar export protein FliJ
MPQFQFRLATLLKLHEATRDERRSQLTEALRAEQVVVERIAQLDGELAALRAERLRATRAGATVDIDALSDGARYEMILKLERQSADQQRQVVAAEADRRRAALVAADREVRVLERLRETQLERHRQEEERRERIRLDELAVLRHQPQEAV